MELIVVSDSKIKITLSPSEVRQYGLEVGEGSNGVSKKSLTRLLEEIKRRCGFESEGEKVVVQMWPDREGGCEMYITRVSVTSPLRQGAGKRVYAFDAFPYLLAVCGILSKGSYVAPSDAWRCDDGKWYLSLEAEGGDKALDALSFVEEYGQRQRGNILRRLSEHGTQVATGNAVERLASIQ